MKIIKHNINIISLTENIVNITSTIRKNFFTLSGLKQLFIIKYKNNIDNNVYTKNYMSEQYRIIEYPLIILFCIIGAIFLISSFDIISIFLSIELQSYALYLICSIYRNSESSINAGLTYFLLGGLSSCIILLGISLLYINSGTTNLENIYIINNISDIFTYNILYMNNNIYSDLIISENSIKELSPLIFSQYLYLQISLVIMSVGFLFKISAAPFHFWSPDVYDAIPTIVTTFVAIIPKISIIIFLYKLIHYTSSEIISLSWINNIIISSILSLLIGSILGLTQYRIKRLYAYSTISHLGFILLGLSINNLESTKAMFFYIIQYSASNLNAFIILIAIGYTLRNLVTNDINLKDIKYSPIQLISQLKGYYNINPLIGISLSITLFSFAGIPPLVGFFGKQMILTAAINNGFIFTTLVAILTSVISAVYYLVIIKMIFFEKSNYIINNKLLEKNIVLSSYFSFTISLFTLLITLFMFFDQELIRLINIL
jgi:NADH-ubiquinone oxidoreductase chain 2